MMCHNIGRLPIGTMGLGRYSVSSRNRVPLPPQSITTFILRRRYRRDFEDSRRQMGPPLREICSVSGKTLPVLRYLRYLLFKIFGLGESEWTTDFADFTDKTEVFS